MNTKNQQQQMPQSQVERQIPFNQNGLIRRANNMLQGMGSPTRIGNLFNPALRQSHWDTSNLPEE